MRSITDITRELVRKDEILYEGLRRDLLNLRAAGRQLRPHIEKIKMEKIGLETIVVSLSRIQGELIKCEPIKPEVRLLDITTQTPLSTITYPKTGLPKSDLTKIRGIIDTNSAKFCTMTEGFKEVTVIVPASLAEQILSKIGAKPSVIKSNLFAITVHFDSSYFRRPNTLYAILGVLAIDRVNLIEIISTATELSIIVEVDDVQTVSNKLNRLIAR
jgi:hypothetical protein